MENPYLVYHYLSSIVSSNVFSFPFFSRFCSTKRRGRICIFVYLKRNKFLPTKCQKCNIRLVSLNLILSPKHLLSWQFFFALALDFKFSFDDFQHYREQKILCIEPEHVTTTNEKKTAVFFSPSLHPDLFPLPFFI